MLCIQIFGSKKRVGKWFPPPKCGPKNGTVFGALGICVNWNLTSKLQKWVPIPAPFLAPLFHLLECFIASQYTKKRKTGTSKITISFLSTQLRQPQERHCTRRNNDSDAIVLTMNQTSDTLEDPEAGLWTAQKI